MRSVFNKILIFGKKSSKYFDNAPKNFFWIKLFSLNDFGFQNSNLRSNIYLYIVESHKSKYELSRKTRQSKRA